MGGNNSWFNALSKNAYIDEFTLVASLQVPKDRGLVQVGQVGHVLAFLKLGWIDGNHRLVLEDLFLQKLKSCVSTLASYN